MNKFLHITFFTILLLMVLANIPNALAYAEQRLALNGLVLTLGFICVLWVLALWFALAVLAGTFDKGN